MLGKFLRNWLILYLLAVVAGLVWAWLTPLMLGPYLILAIGTSALLAAIVTYD